MLDVSPEAAGGGMAATVGGLILFAVKVGTWLVERKRKKDMAEADHPVAPQPPVHALPPSPDAHRVRIAQLEHELDKVGWDISDCRRAYRQLEIDMRKVGDDAARTAMSLQATRLELDKTLAALRVVADERDAAEARAQTIAHELVELKREITSGHHGSAAITPMRPPK